MEHNRLHRLIFFALCCDLGLVSKRLIAPIANVITDSLHIPGGIGTSFSLMFLVLAAALLPRFGCATLMGAVQSLMALALGMIGSMGALSPIGYIVPGLVIDIVLLLSRKLNVRQDAAMMVANMLAAASSGLTANLIVFRLTGSALALYIAIALTSGAICGSLAESLRLRLMPIVGGEGYVKP